jgi:carboxyl-terminal processing protease
MKHFLLTYALATCCATAFVHAQSSALEKLNRAELAIKTFYVDKVDENKLVEDAIIGMLKELDPHSTYANAEEVKEMNAPLNGSFEGIGVQFNMIEDTLFIIQPVSGGPSEKVGIHAGDRIVTVNDTTIAGVKMSTEQIMQRLRGPKGTTVNLGIARRGINELLKFSVKRDKIPMYSLDASYIIAPQTGYIRISRFGATTPKEFKDALQKLQKAGMTNLILDLQGNGGGYLEAAVEIANQFLQSRDLIVYMEGRATRRRNYNANGNGLFRNGRLVVLVDEYSASASEIVSGAIQDSDRGVIVGRRTFGKGLVQRPINLNDGSMIRLTIARYYTPSGRSIQKPYGKDIAYNHDLIERYNHGEMSNADSIHFPDSLRYKTLKLGRTVYGGGGIMPDYFVPIDTARYTDYHRQLSAKGVILKATTSYIEQHRKTLHKKYPSFERFNKSFEVGDDLLNSLLQAAEEEKIPFNEAQYDRSLPLIRIQLKALIARDLWDMNQYFQVFNAQDPCVERALEIITSDEYDTILSPLK